MLQSARLLNIWFYLHLLLGFAIGVQGFHGGLRRGRTSSVTSAAKIGIGGRH